MSVIAIIVILFLEVLTMKALWDHYFRAARSRFFIAITIHLLLSIWLWISLIRFMVYGGFYDDPVNIKNQLTVTGLTAGVLFPRFVLDILHFTGRLMRIRKGGHIRWLTKSGIILSAVICLVFASGAIHGRFNVKTEEVTVRIKNLDPRLEGLRIAQLSDLHLSGFYGHTKYLAYAMDKITAFHPDLVINTGDFVSYGWREYDSFDTLLKRTRGTSGNFAVQGNHDSGVYYPGADQKVMNAIVIKLNELITASGYRVLNDEHIIINIHGANVAIIGVKTGGSHPNIIHGDLNKATQGIDSTDLKILLCHDPNQWDEDVAGKTDIDLTFSGHTHGGQFGILTKKFSWSPVKKFYPHWYGLFSEGNQYLYVNRGLGYLGVPFRIWMPPEIALVTLKAN